jgi:hypothetical protein
MDRFVNDRNLEKYRKLACATTTRGERGILLASLAQEKVNCFGPQDVRRATGLGVDERNGREAAATTIRHECGHLLAARFLGFPTGGIHLSPTEAGASIDLLLSLKTIDEALEFIEKRVQVLYAGSLAESLVRKKTKDDVANKLLLSTAASDFEKVRELIRMWVGLKYPVVTEAIFQAKLTQLNEQLYNKAAKLVEDNAGLIDDLAAFVMGEWDTAVKALGIEPRVFRISKEKIDAFLASKQCKTKSLEEAIQQLRDLPEDEQDARLMCCSPTFPATNDSTDYSLIRSQRCIGFGGRFAIKRRVLPLKPSFRHSNKN